MEWVIEALFEMLDIWVYVAVEYSAPKRRLKRLRNEHWFIGYYPKNKETLRHMLNDPEIRTHLSSRKNYKTLLRDAATQEQFKNAAAKYGV